MALTTGEWVTVAVGMFNAVVVPGAVFMLKAMIDRAADARTASVRGALVDHEREDERRFKELEAQMGRTEDNRDVQHVENQKLLTKLSTDFDWLKKAILRSP
jgi:hypothetical protein